MYSNALFALPSGIIGLISYKYYLKPGYRQQLYLADYLALAYCDKFWLKGEDFGRCWEDHLGLTFGTK